MSAATIDTSTTVAAAQAELDRLAGTRAAAAAALAAARERLEEANDQLAALDELEGEVALGERDATEHERARRVATDAARDAGEEMRRAAAVQSALEPRIADAEHALAIAIAHAGAADLDALGDQLARRGGQFREALAEAVRASRARRRVLDQIEVAVDRVRELCDAAGVEPLLAPDELDWRPDGLEELLDAIAVGVVQGQPFVNLRAVVQPASPLTPRADAESRSVTTRELFADLDDDDRAVQLGADRIIAARCWSPKVGWPLDPRCGVDVSLIEPRIEEALAGVPEDLYAAVFAEVTARLELKSRALDAHVDRVDAAARAERRTVDSLHVDGSPQ